MPRQLFTTGLQAREIYLEVKKYFYKENSDVAWKDFLTKKFALWIDKYLSIDNTHHGSFRALEQNGILLQIEKAPETSDAVVHISVTNPSAILTFGE